MHLGLMLECEYRTDATDEQAFSDAFTLADHAESLGWDEVWLAERHFASPARLEAGIAKMRALTQSAGRDPAKIGIAYRIKRHGQPAPLASDGNRKLFTGSIPLVIEDIAALRQLGVTAMDFDFEGRDTDKAMDEMRRFRDDVLGRI